MCYSSLCLGWVRYYTSQSASVFLGIASVAVEFPQMIRDPVFFEEGTDRLVVCFIICDSTIRVNSVRPLLQDMKGSGSHWLCPLVLRFS